MIFKGYRVPWRQFLQVLFPPRCASCRRFLGIPSSYTLCFECMEKIDVIKGPICTRCGKPFMTDTGISHLCQECIDNRVYFRELRSLFVYEGPVRNLIHRFKYRADFYAMDALCAVSRRFLAEIPVDFLDRFSKGNTASVIVPVPLHKQRLRERGFNQTSLLAKEIFPGIPVKSDVLKKTVNNPSQSSLSYEERKKNVRKAFEFSGDKGGIKRILIFDDVCTTGSTIGEIARVAKQGGIEEIFAFTVSRTLKRPKTDLLPTQTDKEP